MAILSKLKQAAKKVKEKVVSTVRKVDVALGGYVPGGPTPSEVKASKAPKEPEVKEPTPTEKPAIPTEKPKERKLTAFEKRLPFQKHLRKPSEIDIQKKLLSKAVSTVALVTGAAGIIRGIGSAILKRTAVKVAASSGKSVLDVTKAAAKVTAQGGAKAIVSKLTPQLIWKGLKTAGAGVIGIDGLMVWYSLDNVISGQKFFVRDLANSVESGTLNPADAQQSLKKSMTAREAALKVVELSAKYNPFLWPFKNLLTTGVEADEEAMQLHIDKINTAAAEFEARGGTAEAPETFDEGVNRRAKESRDRELAQREEDQLFYDQMAEARRTQSIEEREEDAEFYERMAQERRDLEIQWRDEDTAFYEALAEQRKKEYEERQKSKLVFGLL